MHLNLIKAVPGPATVKEEITSYAQFVERYDALLEKFSEIRDLEMTEVKYLYNYKCYSVRMVK